LRKGQFEGKRSNSKFPLKITPNYSVEPSSTVHGSTVLILQSETLFNVNPEKS